MFCLTFSVALSVKPLFFIVFGFPAYKTIVFFNVFGGPICKNIVFFTFVFVLIVFVQPELYAAVLSFFPPAIVRELV